MSLEPLGVKVEDGADLRLALSRAILIYEGNGHAFATVHRVAPDPKGSPIILAGKAMTVQALTALRRRLTKRDCGSAYIPANLLLRTEDSLAWWVPPTSRQVWFRSDDPRLGGPQRTAVVPHPGLVFAVMTGGRSRRWLVWAVKGNGRPIPETPLYRSPYWNTWANCAICVGNVELPKLADATALEAWTDAFFRSWFTHPNDESAKLVNFPGGSYAFWRDMLDGKHVAFPEDALVPVQMTLADLYSKRRIG